MEFIINSQSIGSFVVFVWSVYRLLCTGTEILLTASSAQHKDSALDVPPVVITCDSGKNSQHTHTQSDNVNILSYCVYFVNNCQQDRTGELTNRFIHVLLSFSVTFSCDTVSCGKAIENNCGKYIATALTYKHTHAADVRCRLRYFCCTRWKWMLFVLSRCLLIGCWINHEQELYAYLRDITVISMLFMDLGMACNASHFQPFSARFSLCGVKIIDWNRQQQVFRFVSCRQRISFEKKKKKNTEQRAWTQIAWFAPYRRMV